jgi:hypothetical protein
MMLSLGTCSLGCQKLSGPAGKPRAQAHWGTGGVFSKGWLTGGGRWTEISGWPKGMRHLWLTGTQSQGGGAVEGQTLVNLTRLGPSLSGCPTEGRDGVCPEALGGKLTSDEVGHGVGGHKESLLHPEQQCNLLLQL